jgi:uncharacterized membrane protein
MGVPLHSFWAHLPAALWTLSLASDALFMIEGNTLFAPLSFYCILAGLLAVVPAARKKWTEYVALLSGSEAKRGVSRRLSAALLATLLFVLNFFSRYGLEGGTPHHITPGEFILSALAVTLMIGSYGQARHAAHRGGRDEIESRTGHAA